MVKVSSVELATANTVCPGKFVVLVYGDVSSVENSIKTGVEVAGCYFIDSTIIPNVHEGVFPALVSAVMPENISALGILEAFSIASMILAADEVLKSANLEPIELRIGTGLGGKSFFTFTGDVASVKTGVEVGKEILGEEGILVNAEVIPSPSKKLVSSLY